MAVGLALPLLAGATGSSEGTVLSWEGKVLVISLSSEVLGEGRSGRDLERLLAAAEEGKASAIVFEIGISDPAELNVQTRLFDLVSSVKLPTVAYIPSMATGPGALIALATESIYLGPNGIIGGAGLPREKVKEDEVDSNFVRDQSILKARARSLAGTHGHLPEIAEAFIDPEVEVKRGEEVISKKGEVLTLTADEAVRRFEDRPLLAKGIAASIEEVLEAENFSSDYVRFSPRAYGEMASRTALSRETGDKGKDTAGEGKTAEETGGAVEEPLFGRREGGSYHGKVIVLKVGQDTLATGEASFDFMDRTLKKAELDGAEAVIFDMDTPGGIAWYTDGLVLNSLQNVTYPTYTFVNSRAESAGAIIAVGTDHIYMRPAATIGSALVVSGTGQDLAEAMEDKVTQMIIGSVRNVAELNGHNPDIAEAFVSREKEVRINGVLVHEAGNVLNLNTIRATEEIGGRPLLAKGVARDLSDLISQEGLKGELVEATPTGLEAFAHWVQKLAFLLIIVGLAGAYLELNTPGFGFPGLVSVVAFSLFFFGNYLAGNLVGYELAVLLVIGLLLIAVEVFLFPGAILPGFAGAALVIASLGLAMVDRVDLEWKWSGLPGTGTWMAIFENSLVSLAAGMAGALIVILIGMRFLPGTRLGNRLVLAGTVPEGASIRGGVGSEGAESVVGWTGEATTDLRPSGKGLFRGRLLDVISEGEFVARGESLRVIRHEGSRIVVARA